MYFRSRIDGSGRRFQVSAPCGHAAIAFHACKPTSVPSRAHQFSATGLGFRPPSALTDHAPPTDTFEFHAPPLCPSKNSMQEPGCTACAVSTRQHYQLRRAVTVAMRMQRCGVTLRQLRHDPAAAHEVAYLHLGPPSANGGSARGCLLGLSRAIDDELNTLLKC